jgi:hypothetical protein
MTKSIIRLAAVGLSLVSLALTNPLHVLSLRQGNGAFVPRPGYFPATGDDTIAGGIFCISLSDLAAYLQRTGNNPGATGPESPQGNGAITSGSGPFPAQMTTDPSLPNHTIYVRPTVIKG